MGISGRSYLLGLSRADAESTFIPDGDRVGEEVWGELVM